ncbi:hypothetical protein I302_107722 [Kwoniella bestiolae CBS 10118]|uniref:Uncharacterized protein n=1 Tax=Kwoniella bestiolae CBS 10118 TaxID=1296100 RepID=A0A1B9FXR6_9TREE|nr:hypothetical protein I302_06539 [Kwoniella bestiolae CBS 10118]OCF23556.1 hypothetical protein I302_06539 [Kwoniella bestiolae CBS 10118]
MTPLSPTCPTPSTSDLNELLLLKPDEIILRLNRFAANKYTYLTPNGGRPSTSDPCLTVRCDHYGSPSLTSYWKSHCEHAITFKPKKRSQKVGDGPWIIAGEVKGHNHGPKGKKGDYPADRTKKIDEVKAEKKIGGIMSETDSEDENGSWDGNGFWKVPPKRISDTQSPPTKDSGSSTSKLHEKEDKKKQDEVNEDSRGQFKYWDRSPQQTSDTQSGKDPTEISRDQAEPSTSSPAGRDPLSSLSSSSGSSPSVEPISPPIPSSSTFKSTVPASSSQGRVSASPNSTAKTATGVSQSLMKFISTPTYQADLQVNYDDLFIAHEKAKLDIKTLEKANQVLTEEDTNHKRKIKELEEKLDLNQTTKHVNHKQCKDTEAKLRNSLTEANTKMQDLSQALKARDELDKLKDEEEKMKLRRENESREREREENKRKAAEEKRKQEDKKRKIQLDNEERKLGEKRRRLMESVEKGRSHC